MSAAPGRCQTTVIALAVPHAAEGGKGRGGGLSCRGQSTWSQQRLAERVGEGYLNEGEGEKEREREGVGGQGRGRGTLWQACNYQVANLG